MNIESCRALDSAISIDGTIDISDHDRRAKFVGRNAMFDHKSIVDEESVCA